MTIFTTSPPVAPARSAWPVRAARPAVWAVRVVLAAQFAAGGVLKVTGEAQMVTMFDDIGAGQGLRLLVGACEVAGAAGILVPRLARLAAIGLILLMAGAAATNVVALRTSPVVPLVLLVLAAVAMAGDRRSRSTR